MSNRCAICGSAIPEGRHVCRHCEHQHSVQSTPIMRHRLQIELTTMRDATEFVNITSKLPGRITVVDGQNLRVNAKSIMGMLYALEFTELWCESEEDIYMAIQKFVI